MNRREVLRYTALGSGTAVFAPLLSSILSGCGKSAIESADNYQPVAFTPAQMELVKDVANTILPATDTPSATDVNVHIVIDEIVGKTYSEEDKKVYLDGFSALEKWLEIKGYRDLTAEEKETMLTELEKEGAENAEQVQTAYLHFKQQVIAFYLTSERIAENELNYLPVPGVYEPCIKLEEVGNKKWAI
jgi:hypothetical protein